MQIDCFGSKKTMYRRLLFALLLFLATTTVRAQSYVKLVSATLDFPNTGPQTSSDLTISAPGAVASKSLVECSYGGAVPAANTFFSASMSADNTITVRFSNINILTSVNPASMTVNCAVVSYDF